MKEYRIILAKENPHECNDAEKVVADETKKPSFADVRHMLEIISSSAVLDDNVYNGVFQLFQCIKEAIRRAELAQEEFPIKLLYRNTHCLVTKPEAGSIYSTSWSTINNLGEVIKEALNHLK